MTGKVCLLGLCLYAAVFAADVKPAPAFALKDSSGRTVTLDQYRGKVVLLDFWATWCTGCKQEMPWFVDFQNKFGSKKFVVVGVAMDDDGWKTIGPFLKIHREFRYPMLAGDKVTADAYGWKEALPDTFLIDQEGNLVEAYHGVVNREAVAARIESLLTRK
jgi:peroxiredoxin